MPNLKLLYKSLLTACTCTVESQGLKTTHRAPLACLAGLNQEVVLFLRVLNMENSVLVLSWYLRVMARVH